MKGQPSQDFNNGHAGALFSAFLYFSASCLVWVILGPLAVYIHQDFALSATQKGLLVAIPMLSGAILRIPMGILTDRIGPKRTGIIGLTLTLIPLLWGWLAASHLTEIVVLGLLLGVAGASFAVALPLASRWYPPERQGLAMGIAGSGNGGIVLAALLAPRLAETLGWHNVLGLAIIPILTTLVVFIWLAQDSPRQPHPKHLVDYLRQLKDPDAWWLCWFYGISFGGFVGLATFLVILFHDQYGLTKVMAGYVTAACVLAGSVSRPVGGYLADHFGGVRMLSIVFLVAGLLLLGTSLLPPFGISVLLIFLGMTVLGMGNGAVFQIVPQRFHEEIGVMTGLVGAAGCAGGFFLPTILGFFKDLTGSYGTGFLVFGIITLIGFVSLHLIHPRSWRKPSPTMEVSMSKLFPEG